MKTRLLLLILSVSYCGYFCVSAQTGNWKDYTDTNWFTKDKKEYVVSTAAQLAGLAQLVNRGHTFKDTIFSLSGKTIDLKAHYWEPIGSDEEKPFCGTLDGRNNTITNLYAGQNTDYQSAGLFGFAGNGAKIVNLSLQDGEVVGMQNKTTVDFPIYTGSLIGAIVGDSENDSVVVRNCHNLNVAVISGGDFSSDHYGAIVGGLIGSADGNIVIDACSNKVTVTIAVKAYNNSLADVQAGGLVGRVVGYFTITRCGNTGDIQFLQNVFGHIGGLIGAAGTDNVNTCRVSACYYEGIITSERMLTGLDLPSRGGLIGSLNADRYTDAKGGAFILENCFSNVSFDFINGSSYYPGYALLGITDCGSLDSVVIKDCFATGKSLNKSDDNDIYGFMSTRMHSDTDQAYIKNCLYVVDYQEGGINWSNTLASDKWSDKQENNYVYVSGTPIVENKEGVQDWSGDMTKSPVSEWNREIWSVDPANKVLPRLRMFPQTDSIPNPLCNQPAGYNSVVIPAYSGIKTDLEGTFRVKTGKNLFFSFYPDNNKISDIIVKTTDGTVIPVYRTDVSGNTSYYFIENITEDLEIEISGEGIAYIPEGNWKDYTDTDWFTKDKKEYTISTAAQLAGLARLVNQGHNFKDTTFILANDINLRYHFWEPAATKELYSFRGILNGNNKKIKNLYIDSSSHETGFFGYLSGGAKILDLSLEKGEIIGGSTHSSSNYPYFLYTGSFAAVVKTTGEDSVVIRNCHNLDVKVLGDNAQYNKNTGTSYVGGLLGYGEGKLTMELCTNQATLSRTSGNGGENPYPSAFCMGGLIGYFSGCLNLSSCGNLGVIKEPANIGFHGGGLLGRVVLDKEGHSQIVSCYNTGLIENQAYFTSYVGGSTGGLIGRIEGEEKTSTFVMRNCYSHATKQPLGGGLVEVMRFNMSSVVIENNYVVTEFKEIDRSYYDNKSIVAGFISHVENSGNTLLNISNNLAVFKGLCLVSPRFINDTTGVVSLSNNYAITELNAETLGDDGTGLNGIIWTGEMNKGPVDKWDESVWTIDTTNQNMPLLKNAPNQTAQANPFYGRTMQFHKIILPEVEGITMTYFPGTYHVIENNDFVFTISGMSHADLSNMTVKTDEGVTIPTENYNYVLHDVKKDICIVIDGVKYDPISTEEVTEPDSKVWTDHSILYMHVLRPERVMIYTISGRLYKQQDILAGTSGLSITSAGMYIVRIGKETHKVIIK